MELTRDQIEAKRKELVANRDSLSTQLQQLEGNLMQGRRNLDATNGAIMLCDQWLVDLDESAPALEIVEAADGESQTGSADRRKT